MFDLSYQTHNHFKPLFDHLQPISYKKTSSLTSDTSFRGITLNILRVDERRNTTTLSTNLSSNRYAYHTNSMSFCSKKLFFVPFLLLCNTVSVHTFSCSYHDFVLIQELCRGIWRFLYRFEVQKQKKKVVFWKFKHCNFSLLCLKIQVTLLIICVSQWMFEYTLEKKCSHTFNNCYKLCHISKNTTSRNTSHTRVWLTESPPLFIYS